MSKLRTHFTFHVDTWIPDGESIVEHVAGVEDYQVALATYRAACQRWPGTPITLTPTTFARRLTRLRWSERGDNGEIEFDCGAGRRARRRSQCQSISL